MTSLLSDREIIDRVFHHIDHRTTDLGDEIWREPTLNYRCPERFAAERRLFKRLPLPFCPAAALPDTGSYVARQAAGVPVVAVRGEDGVVRAFRNVCRHRGKMLMAGTGCTRALVCGYHGWSYQLDGRLAQVPDEHGFPGLDRDQYGLAPLTATERHGLVFITQEEPVSDGALSHFPEILGPEQQLINACEFEYEMNWKLFAEAGMEGYHIKMTHGKSFYPYGFDNLNVVETFGPNARVTFPFKRIEKLRQVPRADWCIDGLVTYAYQLFPNVLIAVLSSHTAVQIAEPISPSRTKFIRYHLTNRGADASAEAMAEAKRDADFVSTTGNLEDRDVVLAIQAGLASEANSHFTYGRFEKAIVHYHKTMNEMLAKVA